jgi:DNA adenine methylase
MTELFQADCRRPPLRYHGGKWRLAPWIISHFPVRHSVYVEVFGGAAGVLLRKPRSKIEVYNDLESQVVNFFRIVRDPIRCGELVRRLSLTPFSRDEFESSYFNPSDDLEAASKFVTRCAMGHGTCSMDPLDSNGFRSCDIRAGKSYAREWAGMPDAIAAAGVRFQGVTIENLDFRRLIPKFDSPDTLFYVDPPYLLDLRASGGKGYVHELTESDHRQLAWLLHRSSAKVVLSGYDSQLYRDLFGDWRRVEKHTTANGQRGAVPRTEVLWMNYPSE